ncbi:hypothetical protein HDU93_002630 [Gonapodya sp. JEL0774]|nr:hypothetical protein HDU93_002630 [Gonapodya sp. JEL0774]
MVPYLAQGAAQAVEDAAALAIVLSSPLPIPDALKAYEAERKPRTTSIVNGADGARRTFHMYDGVQQMERDDKFKKEWMKPSSVFSPHWHYNAEDGMKKVLGKSVSAQQARL